MSSDTSGPAGGDPAALRRRLATELTRAVVGAEKRLGRAVDRAELARRLNVSPSSLYAYLNGTTLAGVSVFDDLLAALGVTGPEAGRLSTLRDAADTARRLRATTAKAGPRSPRAEPPPTPVPRQLPPSNPQFVGREAELGRLDALPGPLPERIPGPSAGPSPGPSPGPSRGPVPPSPPPLPAGPGARPVTVATIEGTGGVGKSTLALHWAHRVQDRFPDGQLHVNLRGFDSGAPMEPSEALHGFLQALGVAPAAIPAQETVASALLRTLLSGRRVLLVLDNARSADQVRPLLPSGPGSLAIVTSRNRLDSLVVREGAYRITLDVMPRYAARALLERQIGADRLAREPRAAEELVDLCARLPLALSVAAARAAVAPEGSVGLLVSELRQVQGRLDLLQLPDADLDLRTVFQGSYALLAPPAARLFRLLGHHPGPDVDGPACAALTDAATPPRALLDTLAAAHLVQQHTPGRFVLHDLLRLYAKELADRGPAEERRAGTERLLRHYLAAARLADHRLEPWRPPQADDPDPEPGPSAGSAPGGTTPDPTDPADTYGRTATPPDPYDPSPAPADPADTTPGTTDPADTYGRTATPPDPTDPAGTSHQAGTAPGPTAAPPGPAVPPSLTALEPLLADRTGAMAWFDTELGTLQAVIAQAAATDGLESYAWRLARACTVYLRRSGRRFQRGYVQELARGAAAKAGDGAAWATATRQLGDAVSRLDRPEEALRLLYAALRECRRLGDDEGVREVRLSLVRVHASRGDHRRALPHARLALAMAERTADPLALADGLTSVAQQEERLGRHATALEHGRRAFALYARLGHQDGQAGILLNTGLAEQSLGRHADALTSYGQSLALDRALGDRYREAHALDHLADAHAALGRHRDARALRQDALAVFDELLHPDAGPVRAKLDRMPVA